MRLAERERLKDCDLLCDCERKAESDSFRLADLLRLRLWERLCDRDLYALSDSASQLPLNELEKLLIEIKEIDFVTKKYQV